MFNLVFKNYIVFAKVNMEKGIFFKKCHNVRTFEITNVRTFEITNVRTFAITNIRTYF